METIFAIPNAAEIWYRVDLDPKYPDKTKEKTNYFPLGPEWKLLDVSISEDYMKNVTPRDYIFFDFTDRKYYHCHYLNLILWVRLTMEVTQIKRVKRYIQILG